MKLFSLSLIFFIFSLLIFPNSSFCNVWLDGTHELIERANRVIVDSQSSFSPFVGQSPQIGEQRKFFAVDFSRVGASYQTVATCRAIGKYCYIFVEDSQWQRGTVSATSVARLKRAFDDSTPSDGSKGIYEIITSNLGPAPDEIDMDPRIYILLLDIPDSSAGGNYVAGYFEPINQKRGAVRDPNTGMQFVSNEVELIYIDTDPLDTSGLLAQEILAHEFQHLIHWRHDPNESLWINEGCSEYSALFLCGYGKVIPSWHIEAFERKPQISLVYWSMVASSSLANYGAAYLFIVYLHERFGGSSIIASLISEPADGINGINAVLFSKGYTERFGDVFADWKVANYLDDTSFAMGRYGYKNLNVRVRPDIRHSSFPVNQQRNIESWSADYIEVISGAKVANLQIDFSARNPRHNFDVRVIKLKDNFPVDVDYMRNGSLSIPKFGYDVDKVVIVPNWCAIRESDFGEIISYSYSIKFGNDASLKTSVLRNPINKRYFDIVTRIIDSNANDLPKITVKRLGKPIINEQVMSMLSQTNEGRSFVYQLFIPDSWNISEIKWEIYYLGRLADTGGIKFVP